MKLKFNLIITKNPRICSPKRYWFDPKNPTIIGYANKRGRLIQGTIFSGGLPFDAAKRFFDNSSLLKNAPTFTDELTALSWLRENRKALGSQIRSKEENSLSYLMQCLWTGEKIPQDKSQNWQRTAAAADYYEKNLLMQQVQSFSDALQAIQWLRDNRVSFTGLKTEEENSLGYLMQCLWTGGKIPQDKLQNWRMTAGAADYALKRQPMIERALRLAFDARENDRGLGKPVRSLRSYIDRRYFTYLRNEHRQISDRYFHQIMRFAMLFYGDQLVESLTSSTDHRP